MVLDSTVRSLRVRLLLPLSLVVVVIVIGTVGYHAMWLDGDGTWMDALFMPVPTTTPSGYGGIKPLPTAGRLFTMGLAITGIGSMFYTLGVVMEYLVSVRLADPMGRRRMERRIRELAGHVIVAGMGRGGRQAALELHEAGGPLAVVGTGEPPAPPPAGRGYPARGGATTPSPSRTWRCRRTARVSARRSTPSTSAGTPAPPSWPSCATATRP